MGFGLPAAMGAQAAFPDALVVDIDGDGSFLMNIQELATRPVREPAGQGHLLNNQHLGMVVQWEDRFFEGRCQPEAKWSTPDFAKMAEAYRHQEGNPLHRKRRTDPQGRRGNDQAPRPVRPRPASDEANENVYPNDLARRRRAGHEGLSHG